MSCPYTTAVQFILEVPAVFRAVVGLDEPERETKLPACRGNNLGGDSGPDMGMDLSVSHAGI